MKNKKKKVYCKDCRFGHKTKYGELRVFGGNDICCQEEEINPYSGAKKVLEIITIKENEKGECPYFQEWKLEHVIDPSPALIAKFCPPVEVVNTKKWWQFWKQNKLNNNTKCKEGKCQH